MPYVERVTKAGNTIEIERYFTSRYKKKGISRGDKVKPTKEEQEKVNTRQAERKLRILINANYGYGDYHLVLDYIRRKGEPDRTPEQMRQDIDVFLRECRKEYRKAGLSVCRAMQNIVRMLLAALLDWTTQIQTHGALQQTREEAQRAA